jgi:hypothetical protein
MSCEIHELESHSIDDKSQENRHDEVEGLNVILTSLWLLMFIFLRNKKLGELLNAKKES